MYIYNNSHLRSVNEPLLSQIMSNISGAIVHIYGNICLHVVHTKDLDKKEYFDGGAKVILRLDHYFITVFKSFQRKQKINYEN